MTLAQTIIAILDGDPGAIRKAFQLWVANGHGTGECGEPRLAVAYELCRALLDDVSTMSDETCQLLAMPQGTTYARGADKLREYCALEGAHRFVRREFGW